MNSKIHSAKSKLASKFSVGREDKVRLKCACASAVKGLQTILQIIKDVSGSAGVPGMQAGLAGLLFVLDVVKKMSQNAHDVEQIAKHIDNLAGILQRSTGGIPSSILSRIDRLSTSWSTAADEVRKIASRHVVGRFLHYSDDVESIREQVQTITWSIESFTAETLLAIEFSLDEHIHFMKPAVIRIGEKIDTGFQQVKAKLEGKDGQLPHATFAQFDCKFREYCLEGTRTDILARIYRWIDVEDLAVPNVEHFGNAALTDPIQENLPIFWINGSAGTGKTTIACTVANALRSRGVLGASFFCSRDDADCSNPYLIFTTIARQLAQFCPSFRAEVARTLELKPDIGYASVPYQLEELIVKPLRAVGKSFPRCVVILDALDECKDNNTTSIILSSLSRHVAELVPLKILITSRPEMNITRTFKSSELATATQRLVLHEVELGVVQEDIERYLAVNLTQTGELYHLECSWPTRKDTQTLALLSFGLFIFAATSVKFIADPNFSDPRHQLTGLLQNVTVLAESSSSPFRRLDELYSQVLARAFPDISFHLAGRLKMVLGTIILLRDPLSPSALEQLLGLESRTVRQTLASLHSVIIVPEDDVGVIRLLHPSFFDFMTNPTRCSNPKFVVHTKAQHTLLAHSCLNAMCSLKQDICGIKNTSLLNSEVDDLAARVTKHVPLHLRYACRHWAFHLVNSMFSDILLESVKGFCEMYLLYWVEACSLLGELRDALLALDAARHAIAKMGKKMTPVMTLLHDCERFTREFFPVLSVASLQVYHSALLFTPRKTLLYEYYCDKLSPPTKVHNAAEMTWHSCIRTMEGHSDLVSSVTFSSDGTCVVSGSYDHTVRLWDAVSGAHLNTLEGHFGWISSVAFSPDGARIVSGSSDKTLRLWDAASGTLLKTLEGHRDWISSVAFSPDGTCVVSGSPDKTLRLWDAVSGAHMNTLEGHLDWISSVTFSPDGTRVVSASNDKTLRLWDAVSGTHLNTLEGHSDGVYSVAFSPDGTRVVSASNDKTLRLWDAVSGAHLNTLEGHLEGVYSVAFSPDGTRVVSGSSDKTLRLWDTVSGAHLNTLEGHLDGVYSVAFSPDGTRVVSGSPDKTLRLWDAVGGANLSTHLAPVHPVAFSLDGTRVVSGSSDKILRLWDATSGIHLNTLEGHLDWISSVAFSPDGTRVVSGSPDKTLRLWDAVTGTHLNTLEGRSRADAFSPDGTRVVSGSSDRTLRLWGAVDGARRNSLEGHLDRVYLVAFSPDGTRVVSASNDKTLRLWDAVSGVHLNTFEGYLDHLCSVTFSPDGTHIVSRSFDGTLRLWDTASGTHLSTLTGHSDSANSVALSLNLPSSSLQQSSPVGYMMAGGWIFSTAETRRLCWIPVSCRPWSQSLPSTGNLVALGTLDGRIVIFDFTDANSYLDSI